MKANLMTPLAALTVALTMLPLSAATHDGGCIPDTADPATYNVVDLSAVGGPVYYVEERDTGLPPVPLSGFLLGNGTWIYEESNGVPGLQRGGLHNGVCQPKDLLYDLTGQEIWELCLILSSDPINDLNCGHNGDKIVF